MHLLVPLTAFIATALATTPTGSGSIVAAIQTIQGGVVQVNNTLNNFHQGDKDSVSKALAVQRDTDKLGLLIVKGTSTAKKSAPLSSDESEKVAVAVLQLQPDVFSLLDNLKAHKPAFDTALNGHSVSNIVAHSLKDQKDKTAKFGAAVASKLAQPYADAAPIINQQFSDKFDETIAYFSTK